MVSDETKSLIAELYHGEFLGERMLDQVIDRYDDPAIRHVLATAAQLETETKARLRPSLVRLGIPLAPPAGLDAASAAAFELLDGEALIRSTYQAIRDQYIPRYEAIMARVAQDGDPLALELARSMVGHETALCEMLRRLIDGTPDPTAPVDVLLHYKLPLPA